jgi:hypothetical protein
MGFPWINELIIPCETLPTNHMLPHGHHMDWRAHIPIKLPQNTPCTWNYFRGPHTRQGEDTRDQLISRSVKWTLGRLIPTFHVLRLHWS